MYLEAGGPARTDDLGLVHTIGAMYGLDVVRSPRRGLPVAVEAVPLFGGVPEAGGDVGRVDVIKVLFDGRRLLYFSFIFLLGVHEWAL